MARDFFYANYRQFSQRFERGEPAIGAGETQSAVENGTDTDMNPWSHLRGFRGERPVHNEILQRWLDRRSANDNNDDPVAGDDGGAVDPGQDSPAGNDNGAPGDLGGDEPVSGGDGGTGSGAGAETEEAPVPWWSGNLSGNARFQRWLDRRNGRDNEDEDDPAPGGSDTPTDGGGMPGDSNDGPTAGGGGTPGDGGEIPALGDSDTPGDGGGSPATGGGGAPADSGGDLPTGDDGNQAAPDTVYIPEVNASAYNIGWAGLSAEEQLVVELVNRARMDPQGEVSLQNEGLASGVSGNPAQPLGVLSSLSDAAGDHAADMEARNYFAHRSPEGTSPTDRAQAAGYADGGVGENIGWIGSTRTTFDSQDRATTHHDNLWASSGHQKNLMNPNWDAVGVGYAYGDYTYSGTNYAGSTFVAESFGNTDQSYLTGVVIDDLDGDSFYDIGEGQGDVMVTAYNDGGVYTTSTYEAGGYTLELSPGTYTVVFHGGDLDGVHETEVTIGGESVKLDVIEDRDTQNVAVATTGSVEEAVALSEASLTSAAAGDFEEPGAIVPSDDSIEVMDAPAESFALSDCNFEFDRDLYRAELLDEAEMATRFQAMLDELGIEPGNAPFADLEAQGAGVAENLDGVGSLFLEETEVTSVFDSDKPYEGDEQSGEDLLV